MYVSLYKLIYILLQILLYIYYFKLYVILNDNDTNYYYIYYIMYNYNIGMSKYMEATFQSYFFQTWGAFFDTNFRVQKWDNQAPNDHAPMALFLVGHQDANGNNTLRCSLHLHFIYWYNYLEIVLKLLSKT